MSGKSHKTAAVVIVALAALDVLVWLRIASGAPRAAGEIHFLDVGQGDAILVVLPGGIKILTDAGPDSRVRRELENALPEGDRYLDLVLITHPQLDHFGGLAELLRSYEFGALLWNGRAGEGGSADSWRELFREVQARNIPAVRLAKGDKIHAAASEIQILSPDKTLLASAELNDTGLIELVKTPAFKFLSMADTDLNIESRLVQDFDLSADVLKVGHHGSKYSSGEEFLRRVRPRVAVISAGRGNRYGHPAPEAIARLKAAGAAIFRTDKNGSVSLYLNGGKLELFAEK
jgi:beta-lactamase superfamily II metal-dependent hydrolase